MDNNEKNKENRTIEDIKNIIKEKENEILLSQIKVNHLESKKNKLEKQKRSIEKGRRRVTSVILFHTGYSLVILCLLISYITPIITILKTATSIQKTVSLTVLYVGVLLISTLGAYTASKVEMLLKKRANLKCLEISEQIEIRQQEITKEIELQESIKKEITLTLDKLDINRKEILLSEENLKYSNEKDNYIEKSYIKELNEMTYIKRRKRY